MRPALRSLLFALALWAAPAPPLHSSPSDRIITSLRAQLLEEPDVKARRDLLSALDSLEAGAAEAAPGERQAWIDSHLGELNAAVRALGADAPAQTARKAARQAAKLNNRAERWEEARAFAERALSFDPEDRDALISRSQANSRLGEYARAFADADRVARAAPDAAAAYTARAGASYGLGNYLQAIEDARKALALDPEDKTAFSIMKLSEGRARAPVSEQGRTRLADSVEREYHGMIQQLNEVEERRLRPAESPSSRSVQRLTSSASSKLSVKDYWGAIEEADKALALDPANPQALYYRAVAHNLIGEYGLAARDAARGLIAAPSDWAMRDARAWAYNHMGRIQDAIADAQHALELNPRDAYAFANRAFANEQRGDFAAMAEDYKAAAQLSPQFEPAYRDAARRHGLDPKPLDRERDAARLADRIPARVRSFAVVLFASLLGGLLIALGVLHVVTGIKERAAGAGAVPAASLEAGYDIGKAIGQGGMGVVYEAVDRKLRRPVAVKMLRDEFKLDETAKVRFLEEARTVAELSHPAIVDIHAIVEDERGVSLVFERLEGRTLDEILAERRRLPLSEVKDILGPVCSGLSYAHAHDVVHRDLKPSNIMLLKGGGVKLLDFGISRHAARAAAGAATRTVTGTPHYMAPEQEYGSVRKENDVFSLGAVLYEMVTGARPYEGSCQAKLAKAYILASRRAPGVSLELDALIDRALEPDAEKRIPSPAEFWRQLNAAESDRPARRRE